MSQTPFFNFGSGTAPEAPNKIGKYQIAGLLGKGASGLVYKGFDPFVRRDVAVKVGLQLSEEPRHLGGKDAPVSNFFVEARAAGMLNHPNIVALYDAGMEDDLCYIVMEFVDGDTLLPWCRKGGPRMPLLQAVEIMHRCAKGLEYSHSRGVLHRDIKPSNIMLTRDGTPKIMDFSIAEINDRRSGEGEMTAVGSPLYMSPEQVTRQQMGPASDFYSLGAVMFQLLTGETPFFSPHLPGLFTAIRNQPPPGLELHRPEASKELCSIVARLLAKKPQDRLSGIELVNELGREVDRLRAADTDQSRRGSRDSLRGLSFFNAFSEAEIDEVLSASQLKSYSSGTVILEEGEMDNSFFILAMGQAIVKKADKPLHVLSKGDCFGEIGLIGNVRRSATVVAASQVVALKVSASLLDGLNTESQLRFYKTFTQTLIHRLTLTSARLTAALPPST